MSFRPKINKLPEKYKVQAKDIVLQLQVKISKDQTETLQIVRGRSVERTVSRFADRHKLNIGKREKLKKLVFKTVSSFVED